MQDIRSTENSFLSRLVALIEENVADEQFGVSELALKVGMSRSSLLRKVKKLTGMSVSKFMRQIRLEYALVLLKERECNVSEAAFESGFNSTSYFIKCFHELYGFPPGEVAKREHAGTLLPKETASNKRKTRQLAVTVVLLMFVVAIAILFFTRNPEPENIENCIAVLPFINESADSSNLYFVNGLMESILNNLQKIQDLKVSSRTSVERYRNTHKTIPEMARELNVNYFVEGSGQKINDEILLNIQLIDARTDKHLWSEQYSRMNTNIFELQSEVAEKIALEIEAIITPAEKERIQKRPTSNVVAYDYFLKGVDQLNKGKNENLHHAIEYFEKAVQEDQDFARAYAALAMTYYYLDIFKSEKQYTQKINYYSDKALLLDAELPQSLVSKALYYMLTGNVHEALPYFEKALEYNPNSAFVLNYLSDFYTSYEPNTSKYLIYALKGSQLDIASNDSTAASFIYLHVANALIQTGFAKKALHYANLSLEYNPENLYTQYVMAYIQYAINPDLTKTKERLLTVLSKDTTRLDVLQEVAKVCYMMGDYKEAYRYYKPFIDAREKYQLDIYKNETLKIAYILKKMGYHKKAEKYLNEYKVFMNNDPSLYKNLLKTMYYAYEGDTDTAIEYLELFSQQTDFHYWVVLFFKEDPMSKPLLKHPQFNAIWKDLEKGFWKNHRKVKSKLAKERLI